MNRDVEFLFRQLHHFGEKMPSVLDCFGFKVVPKAEVAQHLKEGVMPRGVTNIFQIVVFTPGAQAGLTTGRSGGLRRGHLTGKDRFKRHHTGIGKKQGRIIGNERRTRLHPVITAFKIVQKRFSDIHSSPLV